MSYFTKVASIAALIEVKAKEIASLEKSRNDWVKPECTTFLLGHHMYVTRKDGTTPEALKGVKREALKAFDDLIFAKKSELEGLRFRLVNVAKEGGAA